MQVSEGFIPPEILTEKSFIFLIALMGWMPAPIEASVWSSLWAKQREEETGYKNSLKSALVDFKVGYIGTAILALVFVGLGAFVMYGTGQEFASSTVGFTKQLIGLYTQTLGSWSAVIISIVALITMVSTTLTVVDAYPRSLEACLRSINNNKKNSYVIYLIVVSVIALIIINYFSKNIRAMVDLATIISFIAAPIFSWLNFKLVSSENMPKKGKPKKFLIFLSYAGLTFLSVFALIFLAVYFDLLKFN
jgi:Mn2+/Fe2+ NRAMP family transporter